MYVVLVTSVVQILNLSQGLFLRSAVFLVAQALLLSAFFDVFYQRKTLPKYRTVIGIALITFVPSLTNGGLTDPRGSLGIASFVMAVLASLGIKEYRIAIVVACLYTLVITTLHLTGVVEMFRVVEKNDRIRLTTTVVMIVGVMVLTFLLARLQLLQEKHLSESNRRIGLAEAAKESESRFLSNMSHEIRNPLNGVAGLITLALGETSLESAQAHLRTASVAARHLAAIVNDILDFKQLESGEFGLREERFDFTELRRGHSTLNEQIAAEKNIRIEYLSDNSSLPRFLIGDSIRCASLIGGQRRFPARSDNSRA